MGLTSCTRLARAVHSEERLRRPSMNYLEYQYAVEDPKVLTKPWTSAWRTYSLASEDLTENFCTNTRLSIGSKR